jgi:hypothetical protein
VQAVQESTPALLKLSQHTDVPRAVAGCVSRNLTIRNAVVYLHVFTTDIKHHSFVKCMFDHFNCKKRPLFHHVCLSARQSVRPSSWNNVALTGLIFMKFDVCGVFENLSRKYKCNEYLTIVTGPLHEDLRTFMIISR